MPRIPWWLERAARIERATLVLDADASTHVCRLSYRGSQRETPCEQVVTAMQTELRIPTSASIVVVPSKEARYDEVGRLIQSLNAVGYGKDRFDFKVSRQT